MPFRRIIPAKATLLRGDMFSVSPRAALCAIAILAATPGLAQRGENGGAVIQSTGNAIGQGTKPDPLHLSDTQRAHIRQAVAQQATGLSFATKAIKPAAKFVPALGAKIPKQVKGHTLPAPLLSEMPVLKQYNYVKFKDQVLLVDPTTQKIVDLFPLHQG
jgi:hypothetical protein